MIKHYIHAITTLLLSGSDVDVVLANLQKLLKRKGHESIHREILKGVALALTKTQQENTSTIVIARETDEEKLKLQIVESLKLVGGELNGAIVQTDSTLIGGYIATHQGKSIDASYKSKLVTLYQSITA